MSDIKTIGVLTSGGDAPGMNAAIRAVVRAGLNDGLKVKGIHRGYLGLIEEEITDMDTMSVSDIVHRGGTILNSSRCMEMMKPEGQKLAAENARKHGIDGIVVGSPVYYGSANGTLMSALQRLFYSSSFDKKFKVGASVVTCRRSGTTATFDELNKFFTISNMPIASSQYWNNIYGAAPGEAEADEEGRQVMRVLARNMIFLMKSIEIGKEQIGLPGEEERVWTNFTK